MSFIVKYRVGRSSRLKGTQQLRKEPRSLFLAQSGPVHRRVECPLL